MVNLTRRSFLQTSAMIGAAGLGGGLLTRGAMAAQGTLDVFFNSDTNITDFWASAIKPGFEAANPGLKLNIVPGGGGAAMDTLAERAYAALKVKKDPQVDMFEAYNAFHPADAIKDGLWVDFSTSGIKNWSIIDPVVTPNNYTLPYRGSQVVLFYNGDKIKTAPKTFAELVAWIKANPGQFAYSRPDLGDSGACFIERALQEVTGQKPELFGDTNYTADYANPMFSKLFDLLKDLAPSLYQGGGYTGGNTPSIQLLASGAISMTIAWSDMALQAMHEGVVADSIKVAQLQDLPFTGGFSGLLVPTNAANKDAALKLADYVVSAEVQTKIVEGLGGFPGVKWSALSEKLQKQFADVAPKSIPVFPPSWEPALFEGWYRSVAADIKR